MMNDVFHEYLDDFVVCYIDDIFIFSKNMANHEHHVHLVLEKLRKVSLYVKLKKCGFHQFEVEFLDYIIFGNGVRMDLRKLQTIVDWATLAFVQDVQCFFWVRQLLLTISCTLFHNDDLSYSSNLK
jgi:hypothetical protein